MEVSKTLDPEEWIKKRTFHHSQFSDIKALVRLKEAQQLNISLCFPTLNEAKTIGKEIRVIKQALQDRHRLLDEIIVVDSGSTDRTRHIAERHGASVFVADDHLGELGRHRGKGENLWKSLYFAGGDIIVWVDADIRNIDPKFVYGLVGPLLAEPDIGYVKAFYKRPIRTGHKLRPGGGRVTELLVRPFLSLLFPDLSLLAQPLSGEYAGRRSLLERVPFYSGYAVEVGLLIDIERQFGIQSIAQVDMDMRVHRNQPIDSLRRMSYAILSVLMKRSEDIGKLALLEGLGRQINLVKKEGEAYLHDAELVSGAERPPMITVPAYRTKRGIPDDDLGALEGAIETRSRTFGVGDLFRKSLININLKAANRDEALLELVELLQTRKLASDPAAILAGLQARERQMSTAIGHGVAVPHILTDQIKEPLVLLGRSEQGINFSSSILRRQVHLIFMILANETARDNYLEILSSLAQLLKHRKVIDSLMRAESAGEVISMLKKHEALIRLRGELDV
ncbi:MAG: glucosyl-3-phosphoglycerate synthase [Spirochaetales bacterium]|nr:glucosyl-3-phosphoglycerate synthase [Spirochaetales bacterium]